jgi:hypothetical protein
LVVYVGGAGDCGDKVGGVGGAGVEVAGVGCACVDGANVRDPGFGGSRTL